MPPPLESHSEFTGKGFDVALRGQHQEEKGARTRDNGHENTSDSQVGTNDNLC